MIRTSLLIWATGLVLLLLALITRLNFLAASKTALFLHCGASMAVFIGILGLNLFAAVLAINPKILLKDTGRELSAFDNPIQAGSLQGPPPFLPGRRGRIGRPGLFPRVQRHES